MPRLPQEPRHLVRARPRTDLEHRLLRQLREALQAHRLLSPGDRIAVGLSGSERSFTLLHLLDLQRRRLPFEITLCPVFVQAAPDDNCDRQVTAAFESRGFSIAVTRPADPRIPCGWSLQHQRTLECQRTRRALIAYAVLQGCTKIASGDLLDDFLEELLRNLFFAGRIQAKAIREPVGADRPGLEWIRPLAFVEESIAFAFAAERGFTALPPAARLDTRDPPLHRAIARELLCEVARVEPRVRRSMLAAMQHLRPTHLLDHRLNPPGADAPRNP